MATQTIQLHPSPVRTQVMVPAAPPQGASPGGRGPTRAQIAAEATPPLLAHPVLLRRPTPVRLILRAAARAALVRELLHLVRERIPAALVRTLTNRRVVSTCFRIHIGAESKSDHPFVQLGSRTSSTLLTMRSDNLLSQGRLGHFCPKTSSWTRSQTFDYAHSTLSRLPTLNRSRGRCFRPPLDTAGELCCTSRTAKPSSWPVLPGIPSSTAKRSQGPRYCPLFPIPCRPICDDLAKGGVQPV
jgi:hypothetical protein